MKLFMSVVGEIPDVATRLAVFAPHPLPTPLLSLHPFSSACWFSKSLSVTFQTTALPLTLCTQDYGLVSGLGMRPVRVANLSTGLYGTGVIGANDSRRT